MNQQANAQSVDLESLLDISLDDLADLPEFKVFPAGAHRVTVTFESKKIGEHPAVELKLAMLEVLELANPDDVPPAIGTESSTAYMLDNEFGQGNLKKVLAPLGEHFGTVKLLEILNGVNGCEVMAVTKIRPNKEKTQTYMDIVSLSMI